MMISILISTIDDRIQRVKDVLLSQRDDVEYIVSHQYTRERYKGDIPSELKRDDVTISQIEGKGVSESRNNAIRLARGKIALVADDDVTYKHSYIDLVKDTFQSNPDIDVALFKIKTAPGEPGYKNYPETPVELKKKIFAVSSIEMSFRISKIKDKDLHFDERFGAGHEYLIGAEETIFVEDCIKNGFKVVYVPEFVVEHSHKSNIDSVPKFDKRKNWLTGAYDCRTNGSIALLKAFLGTVKMLPELLKYRANPLTYFYHRLSAALYILRTNSKENLYGNSLPDKTEKSKSKVTILDI